MFLIFIGGSVSSLRDTHLFTCPVFRHYYVTTITRTCDCLNYCSLKLGQCFGLNASETDNTYAVVSLVAPFDYQMTVYGASCNFGISSLYSGIV
jgi:hypothetical protein